MKVGAFLLAITMNLDAVQAITVFKSIKELREEIKRYCLAPDRPDLSVEDFQHILTQQYGIAIEKKAVTVETQFLAGMVERYDNRAIIFIKADMDREWLRFVSTKELCHLLIDDGDMDCSSNGVETIEYLLEEYKIQNDDFAERVAQSEALAEIAAIELMYPYSERCVDRDKVASGELTTLSIAEYYCVPEFIVSRALADWFHKMATTIWHLVDDKQD
jgi:Zn-dependent peptidase ImmA (M78 family)